MNRQAVPTTMAHDYGAAKGKSQVRILILTGAGQDQNPDLRDGTAICLVKRGTFARPHG